MTDPTPASVAIERALDALGHGLRTIGRAAATTEPTTVDHALVERLEELTNNARRGFITAAAWACVMSPAVGGGLYNAWEGDSETWPALATVARQVATRIERAVFCEDLDEDEDDDPDEDA